MTARDLRDLLSSTVEHPPPPGDLIERAAGRGRVVRRRRRIGAGLAGVGLLATAALLVGQLGNFGTISTDPDIADRPSVTASTDPTPRPTGRALTPAPEASASARPSGTSGPGTGPATGSGTDPATAPPLRTEPIGDPALDPSQLPQTNFSLPWRTADDMGFVCLRHNGPNTGFSIVRYLDARADRPGTGAAGEAHQVTGALPTVPAADRLFDSAVAELKGCSSDDPYDGVYREVRRVSMPRDAAYDEGVLIEWDSRCPACDGQQTGWLALARAGHLIVYVQLANDQNIAQADAAATLRAAVTRARAAYGVEAGR